MSTDPEAPATVATTLQVGHGFTEEDRARAITWLSTLDARLSRYPASRVTLELSVKQRGTRPSVTLIADIAGRGSEPRHRVVATSDKAKSPDATLQDAILDARDDLRRQLNRIITRRETARRR